MQDQAKYMNSTWSPACEGKGHDKFMSSEKRSNDAKYPKHSCHLRRGKDSKFKNTCRVKDKDNSNLNKKLEHFKFEKMDIGVESNSKREYGL